MTEKDDDIQTQHSWRNKHVDAVRSGIGYPPYPVFPPTKPMSNRRRVREEEAAEVFDDFMECYKDWFRPHKVQYNTTLGPTKLLVILEVYLFTLVFQFRRCVLNKRSGSRVV